MPLMALSLPLGCWKIAWACMVRLAYSSAEGEGYAYAFGEDVGE